MTLCSTGALGAEVSCSEYDQTHRLGMTFDELQALHAALTEVIAAAVTASGAEGAEDIT